MPVFRAIRIHMPDRPGALSAISTALAAHQVDIVRLDVVSHEGSTVVDDLILSAGSQEDIGHAIGGFYPEVTVRTFEEISGDPALEMGTALGAIASSPTIDQSHSATLQGANRIVRADDALLLRASGAGDLKPVAATVSTPGILAAEPFAGRWVLERRAAAAFPVADGWAPQAFQHAIGAAWVAIAPAGAFDLLIVTRKLNIPFYTGELERLAAFAEAASAIIARAGDRPHFGSLPAVSGTDLPARAVTLAGRLPIS
ncbi:MAG: ACT domain-containing protein [bacterium]